MLVGRNAETLEHTNKNVAAISESSRVLVLPTDVSNEPSVKALFEKVKDQFGKVHILVNAAGTMGGGPIGDIPLASWWGDFVSTASRVGIVAHSG